MLRYLPTNMTRPEIARELYVSINTVNTHIRNIYSKLGAQRSLFRRQRAHGSCGSFPPGCRPSIAERSERPVTRTITGFRRRRLTRSGCRMHRVATPPGLYTIRIKGRLGATALSAFPAMVSELKDGETVLTGLLEDRSAVFGVLGQIEALGLELVELRQIRVRAKSPGSDDARSPDGA